MISFKDLFAKDGILCGFNWQSQLVSSTYSSLFHLILRVGGGAVMTMAAMMLVPRYIRPSDMGLAALSVAVFSFLSVTSEGGFRLYSIRNVSKESGIARGHLFSVQVVHIILIIFVLVLIWAIGSFILPRVWRDSVPMIALMLSCQPLYFRRQMATVPLEYEMDFRTIGRMELLESLSYNLALIAGAVFSLGAWSFVGAHFVRCLVSYSQSLRIPFLIPPLSLTVWSLREIRGAYRYGFSLQGAQWLHSLRGMLIGGFLASVSGAPALGLYDRAQTLGNAALGVMQGVSERFLFAYSSKNHKTNIEKCRKALSRAVSVIAWSDKVIYLAILLIVMPFLVKFWGAKWEGVAQFVPIVALGSAVFGSITFPTYPILLSMGCVGFALQMSLAALGVTIAMGFPLIKYFGVAGACWLGVISWSLSFFWIRKAQGLVGRIEWFGNWAASAFASILTYLLFLRLMGGING